MANATDEKWVKRFIEQAHTWASYSKDPSTQVGAVLVTESCKIVGQGYNGLLPGMNDDYTDHYMDVDGTKHKPKNRDFKLAHTIHAEINAFASKLSVNTNEKLYLFVSKPMCSECAKHAVLNGVTAVYSAVTDDPTFNQRWQNDAAKAVLYNNNITYTEIK